MFMVRLNDESRNRRFATRSRFFAGCHSSTSYAISPICFIKRDSQMRLR